MQFSVCGFIYLTTSNKIFNKPLSRPTFWVLNHGVHHTTRPSRYDIVEGHTYFVSKAVMGGALFIYSVNWLNRYKIYPYDLFRTICLWSIVLEFRCIIRRPTHMFWGEQHRWGSFKMSGIFKGLRLVRGVGVGVGGCSNARGRVRNRKSITPSGFDVLFA